MKIPKIILEVRRMYTVEEKTKIEQVATIFQAYLQQSKNIYGYPKCELLWMENMQYYLLVLNYNDSEQLVENNILAIPIPTAEVLYIELVEEMTHERYERTGMLDIPQAQRSKAQMRLMQKNILTDLAPYLEALPEYQELALQTVSQYGKRYIEDRILLLDDIEA